LLNDDHIFEQAFTSFNFENAQDVRQNSGFIGALTLKLRKQLDKFLILSFLTYSREDREEGKGQEKHKKTREMGTMQLGTMELKNHCYQSCY